MIEKAESKRILTNTVSLYFRTIIMTLISLYTVRVVLQALGESDYGTYNVVGGFVSLFTFVSNSLAIASQRYFAVALGSKDWKKVNKFFSVNIIIFALLVAVIFILAETIGLWFVRTKLLIEPERLYAATVVYQLSIITFLIGIMSSPFLALLIADENLSIYSLVSVIESILAMGVAYLVDIFEGDKLILYGVLLAVTSLITNGFYMGYTIRKYPNLRFKVHKDKEEYKRVFSFLNWNLIGALASVCKSQGINVITNMYFGSSINASRGIASRMNNAFASFSQNFTKAVNPQITKSYAAGLHEKYIGLIYSASKLSYFLLLLASAPFIMNAEYILELWLKDTPDYAVLFSVLVLIDALILSVTNPLLTAVQAIGKVKEYQLSIGLLALSNLPITAFMVYFFRDPVIPFWVSIGVSFSMTVGRMLVFKKVYTFSIKDYTKKVLIPGVVVTGIIFLIDLLLFSRSENFWQLVINVAGSVFISIPIIFLMGLGRIEREIILKLIPDKFKMKRKNLFDCERK